MCCFIHCSLLIAHASYKIVVSMRKFFLLVVVFLSCSSHTGTPTKQATDSSSTSATSSGVSISLTAEPRTGFAPLRVTFRAVLNGVSDTDPTFHCIKQEWDFGDGAVSGQTPNCEPLESGAKIETEFIVEHVYQDKGNYSAGFTIGDKKKTHSNKVSVNVLQNLQRPDDQSPP